MTDDQWIIRKYVESDKDQIVHDLEKISKMSREEWEWKYFGQKEEPDIWVVEKDSTIIGHLGLINHKINSKGNVIDGCHAVDLYIYEEHRRKGIFVELGKKALDSAGEKGTDIAFGFPNIEAMGGHLKYGWKQIGMITRAMKPLKPHEYSMKVFPDNKLKQTLLKSKMKQYGKRKAIDPISGLTISGIEKFDDDINKFIDTYANKSELNMVQRDSDHLNWRYNAHPEKKYKSMVAIANGEIKGFIIGTTDKGNGYIVDMMVSHGEHDILKNLIWNMEEYFLKMDAVAAYTWIPKPYLEIFKGMEYITRKPTQYFIVRSNSDRTDLDEMFDIDNWFITMGDSDLH